MSMRTTITKTVAALLLSATALGATAGSASALLPAIQSARETGRISAKPVECWDWTNEDGTTGTECR